MGEGAQTQVEVGRNRAERTPRGSVLLVGDDGRLVAAVREALRDTEWTVCAAGVGGTLIPSDVRAVVALGDAALAPASSLAAARVPLLAVGIANGAAAAALGAVAQRGADRLDDLAAALRAAVDAAAASVDRIAAALVAPLSDDPIDEYCDRLASMLRATHVVVYAGERGAALSPLGARWPGAATPPRLQASAVAELLAGGVAAAQATERLLGVPAQSPQLWTQLDGAARSPGDAPNAVQLVARAGPSFAAAEVADVERLAGVAALAVAGARSVAHLRRTDAVKAEFVRTVSHELRTPLDTVIGYADLLVEEAFGPLAEEQRRILRRVGDRARGLLEVIAATLDLPGVTGGRVSLATRPVSVARLLAELEIDTREWGVRRDLRYVWDVAADLPTLTTDPGKLRVLVKNLLANAMKFTDRGGITVRARARDGGVELSVEDTGIGIEGEAVQFVFDAFRQANAAASGKYGGVGLGLYIVRRLVALLGGRLRVESEIGVGSKFHVWLPAEPP